jgi:hypothetical protein
MARAGPLVSDRVRLAYIYGNPSPAIRPSKSAKVSLVIAAQRRLRHAQHMTTAAAWFAISISLASLCLSVSNMLRQAQEHATARVRGVVASVQEVDAETLVAQFHNNTQEAVSGCRGVLDISNPLNGPGWEHVFTVGLLPPGQTSQAQPLVIPKEYQSMLRSGRFSVGWEFSDSAGRRWQRPSMRGRYGYDDPILIDKQRSRLGDLVKRLRTLGRANNMP